VVGHEITAEQPEDGQLSGRARALVLNLIDGEGRLVWVGHNVRDFGGFRKAGAPPPHIRRALATEFCG